MEMTLGAWTYVKPTTMRARNTWIRIETRKDIALAPGARGVRAWSYRCIESDDPIENQARASGLGGFSRRAARRGGRTHRESGEAGNPIARNRSCPKSVSVADLQERVGSPEGTLGSPVSPQGVALRQGVVSAKGSATVGSAADWTGGVALG